MTNLKTIKKVYVKLIETYARYGYDISELLNPTYKKIDAYKCVNIINELIEEHEGVDFWEFENKFTIEDK
jgi:outer membrane protein assembly factor BamA|tara:strand:- start:69 stop:278 length:210 start_codon:yes stop_codon:yes gene_type:complete